MRSPSVSFEVAKNRREGSWRPSALNCVKEAIETGVVVEAVGER